MDCALHFVNIEISHDPSTSVDLIPNEDESDEEHEQLQRRKSRRRRRVLRDEEEPHRKRQRTCDDKRDMKISLNKDNKPIHGTQYDAPQITDGDGTKNGAATICGKSDSMRKESNMRGWRFWRKEDTLAWLFAVGFETYVPIISRNWMEEDVDGQTLPELDLDDLKRLGILKLLHRKQLLQKIDLLTSQ